MATLPADIPTGIGDELGEPMRLYHYTCDHGLLGIGMRGEVLPPIKHDASVMARVGEEHAWLATVSWFTDLDRPSQAALGLTMRHGICNRTQYRYLVTEPLLLHRWTRVAKVFAPREDIEKLHYAVGAMPMHWYICAEAVPVVLDGTYRR